jgi:hypothetical protein
MKQPQKARLTALVRIQVFLDDYASSAGNVNQSRSRKALDAIIPAIEAHAAHQHAAHTESQGRTKIKVGLRHDLRVNHMRPIATIAKATLNGVADAPRMSKLAYPGPRIDDAALVAAGQSMADAASEYRQLFIDEQLPEDFVDQLRAAAEALRIGAFDRNGSQLRRSTATEGLTAEFRRAREIVRVLNALMIKQLSGRADLLAVWNSAKRVHHRPGPMTGAGVTPATTPATASARAPEHP